MIESKPSELTEKGDSRTDTSGASLATVLTGAYTTFLLAKISPEDIGRSWIELRDSAKDARNRTTLVRWENGTTLNPVYRADATVYITRDGSVAIFIGNGTYG